MSIKSKLNMEDKGMFASFLFYAVVGIIFLALLPMTSFPPHLGIMGIFSLISAYGLLMKRKWTIWFVIILFFAATTFSAYMMYYYLLKDYVIGATMTVFLILTWVFTAYAVSKRGSLES